MRKICIIHIALFIVILVNKIFAQTTIPNAGFENWTDGNTALSWTSVNQNVITTTFHSLTRSADSHSGMYAAMLKTQFIIVQTVPGICDLGTINITSLAVGGGTPFTGKPDSLKGYYKYTPVGNDSMSIALILTKTNGDTVGWGVLINKSTVGVYTQFAIPVNYNTTVTGNPELMNIILLSSAKASGGDGTTLLVDDLSLVYNPDNGIAKHQAVNYTIYPNPASDRLTIKTYDTKNMPVNIKIYNLTGQEIYNENYVNIGNHNINLSSFKEGLYFVKLSGDNNIIKTEKVLISHNK